MQYILAAAGAFVGALSLAANSAPQTPEIAWTVEARSSTSVQLDLRFSTKGGFHRVSVPVDLTAVRGLTSEALAPRGVGPVEFSLPRSSGTLRCSGATGNGKGSGSCSYLPGPDFAAAMAAAGIRDLSPADQLLLGLHDLDLELLAELKKRDISGFKAADLIEASLHRVDRDYLREISATGRSVSNLRDLATLKMHGLTGAYLRRLREAQAGLENLPADDLVNLLIHGVTASDVRELAAKQNKPVAAEDLVESKLAVPTPPPPPEIH